MARILIIEDEIALRLIIKDSLKNAGYSVMAASDGEKAIQLLNRRSFDMVITDLIMPNKEGLELILELREQAPNVKIIAVSGGGASSGNDLLDMAIEFGAHYALRKPFIMKELMELVGEGLSA